MGNLIWHEYARYVSITASVYAVWAGYWGIFYRKYFWDFVDGRLRDPGGLQAGPDAAPMVAMIVKAPVIQVFAMIIGLVMLCMECPLPLIKNTSIYRNLIVRVVLLAAQFILTILFYQGVNAAVYSLLAMFCYTRAVMLGEEMKEAKENRGRGGAA
ncbi:hypothetical protein CC1G_14182 [Coprinopsis cinerea okayama7|uniref:DUF7727 domain-containing protein n=1 Tax=Coprinopsis cinerea (strain Okayama-7 / 130 / ATCC MYA-4618 / FGSC 9003) TaxID=240176 RepID=D6RLC8_COPC7|nr:hypothetical protein CC1G_14182 [Coprinopsis cinerea okayama7\|eukprot:XP_002911649.1 hypothetical protein CC1G_14182 [Coprinopsis cinerea okayama7\